MSSLQDCGAAYNNSAATAHRATYSVNTQLCETKNIINTPDYTYTWQRMLTRQDSIYWITSANYFL